MMIAGGIAGLVLIGTIGYLATRGSKAPVTNSSTVNVTNQDRVESDGTIVKPDGTMVKPDGTMIKSDGTMVKPDGTMVGPDGQVINENTNTSTNTNSSTTSSAPAKYTTYSSATLAAAQAVPSGDTVLYFHANWCPTCKILDPDITRKISTLPAGLTILKVDYDQETELKKKYGVTYQHTFVQVDDNGNKVKLWSGSTDASAIADEVV